MGLETFKRLFLPARDKGCDRRLDMGAETLGGLDGVCSNSQLHHHTAGRTLKEQDKLLCSIGAH